MSFSVTCSNCDRRFVDIDESLIGQRARCRCGSIVELDPVWDFKKSKTSRRPAARKRPTAPAKPAEKNPAVAGVPGQRGSTTPPSAKPIKPDLSAKRPSAPRRKKRRPEKPRPAAVHPVEVSSPPAEAPTIQTELQPQSQSKIINAGAFDNYADLDEILAAGVDNTPLESTRVDSPFEQPEEQTAKSSRVGLIGACVGGLAGLLAAFILLVTRAVAFGGTPLGWTGHAFYGSYTASYGTGEMTNACTNLFTGIGWWILLLASLMAVASLLLLVRAVIRISSGRQALPWSRGLLATLSVICLFSLMGLVFVQNIHHGNLIRDLNSFSNSAPIQGLLEPASEVETFQDIRNKYKAENTDFMIGVLTFAVLPLISFGGVATSLLFDER